MSINVEVKLKDGEYQERMIRRFVKRVKKDGILEEYCSRLHYVKKSDVERMRRRHKKRLSRKTQQENDAKSGNGR